jgi:tetratricopeptide (TPR) repeat protein
MSALFGRKNYSEVFERLVRSGNIDLALREAIKNGDALYELGNIDEAILNYNTLLNIFTKNNVSKHEIYEKIYEKLAPLYLDSGNKKKGTETALALIDKKITLKKTGEAVKLLKALETSFLVDKDLMLQIVERYVSLGFYREAFEIVDKLIKKESTNVDLLKMGGELLYKLGRFEESYIYFNAIIMLAPDDEFAKSRLEELKSQEVINTTTSGEQEDALKQVEFNPKEENPQSMENPPATLEVPGTKPEELQEVKTQQLSEKKVVQIEGQEQDVLKTAKKSGETSSRAPFVPIRDVTSENALTVDFRKILHSDPDYLEALENIKNGGEQKGIDILKKVAEKFETVNFEVSDYVYNRIIILNPDDIEIKLKLAEIYKERKDIEDCVFYLRSALKYAKGIERLEVLRQLAHLLPEDIELKTEMFNSYVELKDFASAFEIFFKLEDNKTIDNFASRMLPYLKEDIQSLGRVARYIKGKGLSNMVAYQYFYLLGRALFNMGDSVEGTRWLLAASRIAKLPLEDYVMMAQYIKTLPLEGEKEVIGDAILGYLESIENSDKKASLLRLLLELKPDKVDYLIHYLDMLISTNNIGKETTRAFMRLVKMNPVNYKDFVYGTALKLIDGLTIDELNEIATFFDLLDFKEEATKFYSIIMAKDPNNKIALIKFFITSVEGESLKEIFRFFDQFPPSHVYTSLVDPFIEKYKTRQGKDPFNFHIHFALGFLYFLTERYEEAIASFQFVARSHQFEAFMHYFLGICFEKILLQDFAATQYNMAVNMESSLPEVKLNALYRLGILYKEQGKISDYRSMLSEIVTINPGFKDAKLLFDSLPPEDKLIDLNKEEFK